MKDSKNKDSKVKIRKINAKMVISLILTVALTISLVGCSSGSLGTGSSTDSTSDGAATTTTIKVLMDNISADKYQELFNQIGQDLGITINLVIAPGDYNQYLQTQLQSSEKPDLFKLNNADLTGFVSDGLVTDLSEYYNNEWKDKLGEDDWNQLSQNLFNQCRREADNPTQKTDDQSAPLWAIPYDSGSQSFGINRGLIENSPQLSDEMDTLVSNGTIPCKPWELGAEGEVATYTYSEFAGLMQGFQDLIDSGTLTGDAQNLKYAFDGVDALKLLAYSAGGSFLNSDNTKVTFTDPAVIGAAYFIKDGMNKGYIDKLQDGNQGWDIWLSNGYLMDANTGTWEYGTYFENGMDVAMMPIPVPDDADRSTWMSGRTGSCMVLRKGSPNTDMAAAVLCDFISRTSEEFQLDNAMNTPIYSDMWDSYINNNDPDNGGFYPYDANTKKVESDIISGTNGRVQETYYTPGTTWWSTFITDYSNVFCEDDSIDTVDEVTSWFQTEETAIQPLLDQGN